MGWMIILECKKKSPAFKRNPNCHHVLLKLSTHSQPYNTDYALSRDQKFNYTSFLYLASASDPWQAVAVSQRELDFDVDPLSAGPRDPVCPQPVVLIGFQDVTNLVSSDGDVLLIHNTHLLPLQMHTHKTVLLQLQGHIINRLMHVLAYLCTLRITGHQFTICSINI